MKKHDQVVFIHPCSYTECTQSIFAPIDTLKTYIYNITTKLPTHLLRQCQILIVAGQHLRFTRHRATVTLSNYEGDRLDHYFLHNPYTKTKMKPTDLTPVLQRTLGDEAADRLRTAIRSGALLPGARLVERDLAERLGMSRIPVREAIQRLVEEGLVQKLPHRGAQVYTPTRSEIEEVSSLRVVLERFVVERVIARWQPEYELQLRHIVTEMRAAGSQRDLQMVYAQDYHFHFTLWQVAEHSIMLEVLESLRARMSRFLYQANSSLSNSQLGQHIDSHDGLIESLKSQNVPFAQEAFTYHVLSAKDRILVYCQLP